MTTYDVIFVLPYPFSDHPSFPEGILKRALEAEGFQVGVIEAPFWQDKASFGAMGRPRLMFAIISGPIDSVVLNYTSLRKRRVEDLYQYGGKGFFEGHPPSIKYKIRPDRAVIVLSNRVREQFRDVPVIIGGLEASLRRFAHYDFQQERVRRSVLLDSRADVLVTGMGEKQLVKIARLLQQGKHVREICIRGTARLLGKAPESKDTVLLPSFEEILESPARLLDSQLLTERAMLRGKRLAQAHGERYVVEELPESYGPPDLDHIYGQPYTRMHLREGIFSPALRMNLFSITSHRGCPGACSFCSIAAHEGKGVISRSMDSVLREVRELTRHPEWKGSVSNIGGATAETYGRDCEAKECTRESCLYPGRCRRFSSGEAYLALLREARKVKGVRKVSIGSGVRYDVLLKHPELLEEIMLHHAGAFLRIAPEHTEDHVLALMRKPGFDSLKDFVRLFNSINSRLKRRLQLSPYIIVGHPGETVRDVVNMKQRLRSLGLRAKDVQVFTPSPGTLSTAMYCAGATSRHEFIHIERNISKLAERKRTLLEQ